MKNRKLIRLKGYDYTQTGSYFVTICTKDRVHYFGEVKDGILVMNEIGKYCYDEIIYLSKKRENIKIGEFVVMPNHVHIIIIINEKINRCRDASIMRPGNNPIMRPGNDNMDGLNNMYNLNNDGLNNNEDGLLNRPYIGPSLGSIIKLMKGNITKYAKENNIVFQRQGRFHDHIIRDEIEYEKIKEYIKTNPQNRKSDSFY